MLLIKYFKQLNIIQYKKKLSKSWWEITVYIPLKQKKKKGVPLACIKCNRDVCSQESYVIGKHDTNIPPYIEKMKWCLRLFWNFLLSK
jgi:hypothetical protein